MDQDEIRQRMRGPVVTVRTPFNQDGSVDLDGLRNFLDFCISSGSKTLTLTWGDSHFLCLSEAEIAEVTKVTLEHVAKRAMVVSADLSTSTQQAIEFAKHCKKLGSDMHMCVPPDWAGSCTVDTLTDHYREVAKVLPLMINTNIFDPRGEAFGLEVLRVVLEKSDNIAAIKDDIGGSVAQQQCLLVQDRCVMMAGGTKQLHLNMIPFGCESYMSTYLFFCPEVAHRYWAAVEAKDMKTAWDIASRYDQAYYQFVGSLPGGFDAGIHASLEIYGICKRWRRPPYYSLNDEEMERLRDFFRGLSIL